MRESLLISAAALALFGLIRFVFNAVAVRVFGPEYVGVIGTRVSVLTVVAVILAAVPSVLATKFVAEYRGAGDEPRGKRLFSGVVIATALMGILAAASMAILDRPKGAALLVLYVPLFGLYLVFKGTYFAFAMQRRYARAEILGVIAFGVVFGTATVRGSPAMATASLLVHPLVFVTQAIVDHDSCFRIRGGLTELAREWRRYGVYSIATFINAMNGLGSYHLLVVFASFFLDAIRMGYLNVVLATLSPLNLIPTAYGSAAFPEMSRRYGEGDFPGLRTLLRHSTILLQVLAALIAGPFLIAPARLLTAIHVPVEHALITAWCCIAVSLQLNMTSAPSGHFLNATRYVGRHAVLSGVFLVAGTAFGLAALSAWGLAGAGVMRLALDGPLAWARMTMAEWSIRWVDGRLATVVGGQLAILALFASALFRAPEAITAVL